MLVFVYGTLKRGYGNHGLLATGRFLGTASVRGRMVSLGGCPAVTLGAGGQVHGELYEVDAQTLARLDRLEGVPRFYQRTRTRTLCGLDVSIYVMETAAVRGRPQVPGGVWQNGADAC